MKLRVIFVGKDKIMGELCKICERNGVIWEEFEWGRRGEVRVWKEGFRKREKRRNKKMKK